MKKLFVITSLILISGWAQARTIRATDLGPSLEQELKSGDVTIEFRQGDELPVEFKAEGDLLETSQSSPSYLVVKRNFWLKPTGSQILMSFDGSTYKNISDVLQGSFSVGAGADQNGGLAHAVNIVLKAFLK